MKTQTWYLKAASGPQTLCSAAAVSTISTNFHTLMERIFAQTHTNTLSPLSFFDFLLHSHWCMCVRVL